MDTVIDNGGNELKKDVQLSEKKIEKEDSNAQVPEYLKVIGLDPRKFWPKKYRFTRESIPGQLNPLTTSQRNFYESNGYIVIDKAVSPKHLQAVRDQYNEYWRDTVQPSELTTNLIDKKSLNKLVTSSNLLNYVGCFTDEQILLMTTSLVDTFKVQQVDANRDNQNQTTNRFQATINNKDFREDNKKNVDGYDNFWSSNSKNQQQPQQQHSATLLAASIDDQIHQSELATSKQAKATTFENSGYQFLYRDWMYLPFRPIDKIVCAITALEPIEQVLLVVPGTHRVGQCTISTTTSSGNNEKMNEMFESAPVDMKAVVESAKQSKYVNLKPGQTLFYSPGLIHGYSNDLVNSRKNYLAVISYYAAGDCKYIDYEPSKDLIDHRFLPIPVGLTEFGDKNPADYVSSIANV